jgi:hypothetical protein
MSNFATGRHPVRFNFRFVNNSENFNNQTNLIFKGKHNAFDLESYYATSNSFIEIKNPQLNIVKIKN